MFEVGCKKLFVYFVFRNTPGFNIYDMKYVFDVYSIMYAICIISMMHAVFYVCPYILVSKVAILSFN